MSRKKKKLPTDEKPAYIKFDCNIPLKKPWIKKFRKSIIYRAVNELLSLGGDQFIPTWDDTDHFHFCCSKCEVMADVLQCDFMPNYADSSGKLLYALFIWLGCPKCGDTGFRKIYFKPRVYIGQKAFTGNNLLFFGMKEAYHKKQFKCVEDESS